MRVNREKQIFLIGILGNLALSVLKLSIGLSGYSKLLIMDGLFSLLCAEVFLFSWGGGELDKKEKTSKYPYGLGKALFLVLGVAACIALIAAIYMFIYGIRGMGWEEVHKSHSGAMMAALISIIGNELLYRHLHEESHHIGNHVIHLNVACNRIGVAVSSLVLVLVTLASLGYGFLERIGVIIISLILFFVSLKILFMVFGVIMDRIPSRKILSRVERYACDVKGVKKVMEVRARQIGTWLHLEVMIAVDESLIIREAQEIATRVENVLLERIERVKEINVGFV